MIDPNNKGIIDINEVHDANTLAGLLDISVQMVYAGRKDGKLPAQTSATYKECINSYLNHYKNKVGQKASSMYDAKMLQDIRNGVAKEEMQWLEIKKQKEELVDISTVNEMIQPIFQIVKANLVNLTRKYPETQKDIDRALASWYQLGFKIAEKAKIDSEAFVREQLEKEIVIEEAESEALNTFGLD